MTIEDIILDRDQRGVSALRPYLSKDYCREAAQYILDNPGTTLITTGFYILYGKAVETDGPPGAVAIGQALKKLGRRVAYVTDSHGAKVMKGLAGRDAEVVEFPIADAEVSKKFAKDLLTRLKPSLLISIERCSPSADGIYRNMRSVDVSAYTAKVDYLFTQHPHTIGIGDGGNEIGMGNLASVIPQYPKLPQVPAAIKCNYLVISSVSNWGGYGLVAALSQLAGRNLLPTVEEEADMVRKCTALGAVDGFTGENKHYVDGFTLEENSQTLERLHALLAQAKVA